MQDKILVIVPEDFDLGFNLTGIDTRVCATDEAARIDLVEEMAGGAYSIILIDEGFFLSFDSRLKKKIQDSVFPLVMVIPLKRSLKEKKEEKDYFTKMVQSAIGYEIRIG